MLAHSFPRRRFLLGLLFSTTIAGLAYRRRSLDRSGVGGAILSGTTIFGMGGWSWGLSLIYFFVSSSWLSHFREREKQQTVADTFSKGSQRDFAQAMANGGVATLMALGYGLAESGSASKKAGISIKDTPKLMDLLQAGFTLEESIGHTLFESRPKLMDLLQAGFTGALATATADTWATEVGVLSTQAPRLITTGKRVAPGTSGGITLLGTSVAICGAFSLGLVFWGLQRCQRHLVTLPCIAAISGLAGCLFDSLLGATLQAMYYCPVCEKETERRVHSCGAETRPLRGIPWLNNDVVNFAATLFGALVAIGMHARPRAGRDRSREL